MVQTIDKRKIKYFQKSLLNWSNLNGRKFPWRKKGLSNYKIIISEVLLQRTKAETVAKFFPEFIKTYPSWKLLSSTPSSKIASSLKGVGLQNQRAKRLKALAVEMAKRNGRLPRTYEELSELPFFGQYLANAVMLQVYRQPYPLLDVNMARVLERFFGKRKLADIRYDPYLQNLSKEIVNLNKSKQINWGLLDFATNMCKINNPNCNICLIRFKCQYNHEYNRRNS